jgi:hypothetical protein
MSSGESGVLRRLELAAGRRDAVDPGGCNMVDRFLLNFGCFGLIDWVWFQ